MQQEYLLGCFALMKKRMNSVLSVLRDKLTRSFILLLLLLLLVLLVALVLYCVIRKPSGMVGSLLPVNTFNVKDDFYRIVYASECSRLPSSPFDPPHLEQYRNV